MVDDESVKKIHTTNKHLLSHIHIIFLFLHLAKFKGLLNEGFYVEKERKNPIG